MTAELLEEYLSSIGSHIRLEDVDGIYDKYELPDNVRRHIKAVALGVARVVEKLQRKGIVVNVDDLMMGTFLHDIGRSVTHGISHGVIGADIARKEGFPQVASLVERHIGAGLTEEEARSFGLPVRSYMPETLEEKILACVDNLAFGDRIATKEEFEEDVRKKFDSSEVAERFLNLYKEISDILGEDVSVVVRGESSLSQSI